MLTEQQHLIALIFYSLRKAAASLWMKIILFLFREFSVGFVGRNEKKSQEVMNILSLVS